MTISFDEGVFGKPVILKYFKILLLISCLYVGGQPTYNTPPKYIMDISTTPVYQFIIKKTIIS